MPRSVHQDPEGFRANLNACIQALRNVTWVLQKEKRLIEDFDAWYPPHQAALRGDPVMAWVVTSRNRIVKEGDLDTESVTRARVVGDYFAAAAEVAEGLPRRPGPRPPTSAKLGNDGAAEETTLQAPPRYRIDQIFEMISKSNTPRRLKEQSTISIERRWVDRALPDQELLDALAHAYGALTLLIADAHDRLHVRHGVMIHDGSQVVEIEADPHGDGRLPCMVTSRDARTLRLSVIDGQVETGGRVWLIAPDKRIAERAEKRYRDLRQLEKIESILDLVPLYVEYAIAMLKRDKSHGWFLFPFRGTSRG